MARTESAPSTLWLPLTIAALVPALGCAAWLCLEGLRAAPRVELPLNSSEAIVLGDLAQAIRRIEAGDSATARYPMRVEGRDVPTGMISPIEAAVRTHRDDMVAALRPHLSALPAGERRRLICLAVSQHDEHSAEALNGGPVAAHLCD